MSDFAARISRVRMKSGGAEIRVFQRPDCGIADRRGELMRHARIVVDGSEANDALVGHMVIGFFASGKSSVGCYHDQDTCRIPRALLPAWIEDIVRREMIVDPEVRDMFNEMFVQQ